MVRKLERPQIIEHYASRTFLKGSRVIVWDGKRWIRGKVVERNLRGRVWDPYLLIRTDEEIKGSFCCSYSVVNSSAPAFEDSSDSHIRFMFECVPKRGDDPAEFDDMSDPEPIEQIQAKALLEFYPSGFELFCSASSPAIRYEHENPDPDSIYIKTYVREMTLKEFRFRRRSPNMHLNNIVEVNASIGL